MITSAHLVESSSVASDWVALIALLISLFALGWTIYAELTSHERRQADEYWYRLVFSKRCIEPLIEFADDFLPRLQAVDAKSSTKDTQKLIGSFSTAKESVLRSLWISRLFSDSYYDHACKCLDGIEDAMAEKFGGWAMRPGSALAADVDLLRDKATMDISSVLQAASKVRLKPRHFSGLRAKIKSLFSR